MSFPRPNHVHRAPGVAVAPFGDNWAVYDSAESRVSILGVLAGLVLDAGGAALTDLAEEVSATTGIDVDETLARLVDVLDELVALGLCTREPAPVDEAHAATPPRQPLPGAQLSATMELLDRRLAFRSTSVDLLSDVEVWLAIEPDSTLPTHVFDIEPTLAGGVDLAATSRWEFPDRDVFRVQLPGVVNDFAATTDGLLVLHSGAVRTPNGEVIAIAGRSESGKSTLTGALVRAGCDYLGDELIGVTFDTADVVGWPRPLSLDATSRSVLGIDGVTDHWAYLPAAVLRSECRCLTGDVGPLSQVVLPHRDATVTEPTATSLTPRDALEAMWMLVPNLPLSGEAGWRTLCNLTERVPVAELRYAESADAARFLVDEPADHVG